MTNDQNLIDQLDSFLAPQRQAALLELLTRHPEAPAETTCVNMHMHSFFSFNGEGWSPSHLAWNARQDGLYAMALCDFDVLAGLHETLAAADLLRLRAAVSFESRVFFSEYADTVPCSMQRGRTSRAKSHLAPARSPPRLAHRYS